MIIFLLIILLGVGGYAGFLTTMKDVYEYKQYETRTNNVVKYLLWEDRAKENINGFVNNLLGKTEDPDILNMNGCYADDTFYQQQYGTDFYNANDYVYPNFYDYDEDMLYVKYKPPF